jgi:hypothetical protein
MGNLTLKGVALLFICTLSFTISFSQQRKITGAGRDDRGDPPVEATAAARNTRVTATTDANRTLRINLPSNTITSVICNAGIVTQELSTGNGHVVKVALASVYNNLTDVVVIGYGAIYSILLNQ